MTDSNVTIQTASLWSSGDTNLFIGSGGPQGYDPFWVAFADIVSSAGIDAQPFSDQVWNVDAGDEIVFVIAVQNRSDAELYNLTLQDVMPAGFAIEADDPAINVMDGASNLLDAAGDLFGPEGLQLLTPVAPYDPDSGANVVLITFSLQATTAIRAPSATLTNSATVIAYSDEDGGPNLLADPVSATTTIGTSAITVSSAAERNIQSLVSGQNQSYDLTVTLPEGAVRDLRLDELLPHSGNSWFQLLSTEITHIGANLHFASAPVIAADGSITFGNVTNTPDDLANADDTITIRVTVSGAGTTAGMGTLQTTVSAADPNVLGGRWSNTTTNTLGLMGPNTAPQILATSGAQTMNNTAQAQPFAGLTLRDPDPGQTETLRIHLSDAILGRLTGTGLSAAGAGNYVLTGTIDQIQTMARSLTFSSSAGYSGHETITLTLDDGAGGTATDATTTIDVVNPPPPNVAPTIAGTTAGQSVSNTAQAHPFATVTFADPDVGQIETLTVHLSNASLGTLHGATGTGGNYVLHGTIDQLQAAARSLVFIPAANATGHEAISLVLDDGAGGVATDTTTTIDIANPPPPNVAPTVAGTRGGQNATNTMQVRPFAGITFADPNAGQIETLTVHLSNPALGTLGGTGGDYVLHGTVDQLQTVARSLVFTPNANASGLEIFGITLDDGAGGVATDSATQVTIAPAAPAAATIQHYPLAATGSVVTSTANGGETVAQVETYQGPVNYLQTQFIYDGTAPLAIVAQSPNMFIKNVAGSTAVQLLSGQNVVDAGHGSNFLLGGTGTDVFFLDARQSVETWDTIVGFHQGDIVTLWGFKPGVSQFSWDDNAGVGSYTGRTLRADIAGTGHTDASITFAGTTSADTAHYAVTTGTVGGTDYMTILG